MMRTTLRRALALALRYSGRLRWWALALIAPTALAVMILPPAWLPQGLRFAHAPSVLLAILAGLLALAAVELLGLELGNSRTVCCVRSAISLAMIAFAASGLLFVLV